MSETTGRILVETTNGACVVDLYGEIDASLREQASDSMVDVFASSADVIIDAERVTFLDSTGLAFIFQLKQAAEQDGRSVRLRRPSPAVTELIELAGMADLITVEE